MSKSTKIFWQGVLFPIGVLAVVAFGALVVPKAVHALTVESVGATLGLGNADLKETIINVIKWALGLLGLVAVIVILYGGFLWLTSRGNEQQIDKAKRTLINGVIGVVIILLAWAIVLFVQRFVINATEQASAAGCTNIGEVQGCATCNDTAPFGDGQGEWQSNGSCIPPTGTATWSVMNQMPALDATNVSLCSAAVETFGGLNGAENNASAGDYVVNELNSTGAVVGTVTGSTARPANRTAEFTHPQDFKPNTRYEVTRNGFLSSSTPGLPLTLPPQWNFTTGTQGDDQPPRVVTAAPTNTINCLKPNLGVVFSEPMLPSSVHVDNITVSPTPNTGAKLVNIAMNAALTGFTASFDQPLTPNTTYTIRLSAETDTARVPSSTGGEYIKGFKDMCVKNALDGLGDGNTTVDTPADDYVWTFTTADTTTVDCTPKITSIEPTAYYGKDSNQSEQALTITGENFNVTGTGVQFPGTLAMATEVSGPTSSCFSPGFRPKQVGSVACIPSGGWQDTQITTLVPAGLTPSVSATGPITGGAVDGGVIVQNVQSSPPSSYVDIQTPHIDWVSPRDGRVGTFVTIGGTHFGANPGRVIFRKIDGTEITGTIPACAGSNGWSEDSATSAKRSQIIVQVPQGFSINELADIQIEHGTLAGATGRSNLHRFTVNDVARPGLCSLAPICPTSGVAGHNTGGQTATAAGEGLGSDINAIESFYISPTTVYDGTPANLNSGAGTVQSQAPNLGNNNYLFQLSVGGQATNPLAYNIPCLPPPAVVTDASCNLTSPTVVTPSPNPTPNATDVCRNINMSIRFNQSMNATDLANAANVSIRRCDQGNDFTCGSPQALTVTASARTYTVANDTALYRPAGSLDSGYWYEVTVRGALRSDTGVALGQDYSWHFKTKAGGEDCRVEAVTVDPSFQGPRGTGALSTLNAVPVTNTCAVLSTATAFTWATSDASLAPLSDTRNDDYTDDALDTIVPDGTYNGEARLTATTDGKSGTGRVQVVRGYCETDGDCTGATCSSACDETTHRCVPVVQSLNPGAGPAGGMVSVNGCFFGNSKDDGIVRFTNAAYSNDTYDGLFDICGPNTWTDTNILVQAQPEFAGPGTSWNVQVQTSTGNGALTSAPYSSYVISNICQSTTAGDTVSIPASGVPIVCSVSPASAREGATVQYSGENYVTTSSRAFFTRSNAPTDSVNLPGTSTAITSSTSASTQVPTFAGNTQSGASLTSVGTPSGGDYCIATPRPFSVQCEANSECATGCCSGRICAALTACTDNMILGIQPSPGDLQCRNAEFILTFPTTMQLGTLNSTNIQLQRTDGTVVPANLSSITVTGPTGPRTETRVTTTTLLATGTSYQVFVRGGSAGIATTGNRYMSGNWVNGPYNVLASATICQIASTVIIPSSDRFTCSGDACSDDVLAGVAGNQHAYTVNTYDAAGVPLAQQAWTWTQGDDGATPSSSNVYNQGPASGTTCPGNAISSTYCSQSAGVPNGQEQLSVQVTGADGAGTGTAAIAVQSFMCGKPWPASPNAWPFVDPVVGGQPSHNFSLAYCGDDVGSVSLHLPVTGGLTSGLDGLLKEYFLFVQNEALQNTGDAIGVRVLSNPGDLSPDRWYRKIFNRPPSGSTLEIDGYPALREGRTVYVSATNCANASCTQVYPNMYVFSYSENAKAETIKIFEQLLQNLRFNITAPFTPDQQAMLRRDTKRVHAYNEIVYALQTYAGAHAGDYPQVTAGSYINGISVSAWPSWQQTLGQALGITMPKDVLPKWDEALCTANNIGTETEKATCWNQATKRFFFPNTTTDPPESHAIMYRYTSPTNVAILGTFEQNLRRLSTMGDAQLDSPSLAGANVCPAPSLCNGFNIRVLYGRFAAINAARQYVPGANDLNDPTVSIVAPTAATLQGVTDVTVAATDTGPSASGMSSVTFAVTDAASRTVAQTTVTTTGSDSQYHWAWDTRQLVNGTYTLTATATDKAGKVGTATRSFTLTNPPGDNRPPVISLGTPNVADYVFTGSTVTVSATAAEPPAPHDSGVTKVEFYLGTSRLGQAPTTTCSNSCPNSYAASVSVPATLLQQFPNGRYTYSVVAYDAAGNTSVAQLPVQVLRASESTPPTVQITAPTTAISGNLTDVLANATDAGTGVDRVEFFVDTETTPRTRDYTQPYGFSWPHTGYANNSTHTVRAVAYDRAGNQALATQTVTYTATAGPDTERPSLTNVSATLEATNTLVNPLAGASLTDLITINATLRDNVGILRAELIIDGARMTLTGSTYYPNTAPTSYSLRYPWNTLTELVGSHTITIVAYDMSNNVTTVSSNVTVDNQVIMSISQPQSGSTVQDAQASRHCEKNPAASCSVSADCPDVGECVGGPFPGRSCSDTNRVCGSEGFCEIGPDRCVDGATTVPVVVNVTRTCRADQLLAGVQFFIDDNTTTPLPGPTICTNGRCTYNWSTLDTTSNGTHTLKAVGTDSLGCRGGSKTTVIVNNNVVDTVAPTLSNFMFDGEPWNTGTTVVINTSGLISVEARDNNGGEGLAQIDIQVTGPVGGNVGTTCTTSPCSYWWIPPDGQNFTVTVRATDAAGNASTQTQSVNVDRTPPTGSWRSPANGSTVTMSPNATFEVNANDDVVNGYASGVGSVVFYRNSTSSPLGTPVYTGTNGVYTWSGQPPLGTAQYFAEIFDNTGNFFSTAPVTITVNGPDTTPPTSVSITTPSTDNWWFNGTTTIVASAQDNPGGSGIASVQFYLNGAVLGAADTTAPFSAAWDTTTATNGQTYSITARACDRAPTPNCLTSGPRLMRVWNEAGYNPCRTNLCSGATSFCCNGTTCQSPTQSCGGSGA